MILSLWHELSVYDEKEFSGLLNCLNAHSVSDSALLSCHSESIVFP